MSLAVGDQSLSVRISELLEKSVPRKFLKFSFGLQHPKLTT